MKKTYILTFILLSSLSFGQAFSSIYDFSDVTISSGKIDPTPVPTAPGIDFGSFKAVNAIALNSSANAKFSFTNQPIGATNANDSYSSLTGSIDTNTYYEVSLTPQLGSNFTLTQLTFTSQRTGTGIRTYAVRSSVDGYATNLPASVAPGNAALSVQPDNVFFRTDDANTAPQAGTFITFSGSNFTAVTTPITFRIYGFNAEDSAGTFSIANVTFSGSTPVLKVKQNSIAGLNMYPNPVTNGNLYITSNSNQAKSVAVYDILGKQVVKTNTINNTVNVSNLKGGLYIVRITEDGKTETRKLMIE